MFVAAPKFLPPEGMPPIEPVSAVRVRNSKIPSSLATLATPSGMPIPRLTTMFGRSSKAARRAMILRSSIASGSTLAVGTLNSQLKAGLYCVP